MSNRNRKLIFIVEDDHDTAHAVQEVLETEGYLTKVFTTSKDAWKTMEDVCPDLVLTDLMMPAPSGFEIVKAMKDGPLCPDTPIVLYSAGTNLAKLEPWVYERVAHTICKPFELDTLLNCIRGVLNTHENNRKESA